MDGDNAEVQIIAEIYNDKNNTHEKKTIEGSGTKTGNSVKKSHASDITLHVKLTQAKPVIRRQADTKIQNGTMITAIDNHTKNTMESLAKIENSLKHFEPDYVKQYDSISKEQKNQNRTTEGTSDILVHGNNT